jgi:hypothetical protein
MTPTNSDDFEEHLAMSLQGLPGDTKEEIVSHTALGDHLQEGKKLLGRPEALSEEEVNRRLQDWCSTYTVIYVSHLFRSSMDDRLTSRSFQDDAEALCDNEDAPALWREAGIRLVCPLIHEAMRERCGRWYPELHAEHFRHPRSEPLRLMNSTML